MSEGSNTDESTLVHRPKRARIAVFSVALGLALNACSAGMMLTLLFYVPGSRVRPMGLAVWMFEFAGIGLFGGVPISIAGMAFGQGWQRWLGILGLLLNLAVFPVSAMAMSLVAWACGLTIST